jgi:hypothetical protein
VKSGLLKLAGWLKVSDTNEAKRNRPLTA